MKHDEMVEMARAWLSKRCPVVVSELSSAAGETPDVIGFCGRVKGVGYGTHLIECKTSIADYKADAKKYWRRNPDLGMGDYRYFMVRKNMLSASQWQTRGGWGVLEIDNSGRVSMLYKPYRLTADKVRENVLLVSIMRRLKLESGTHTSLTVKSYTIATKNKAVLEIKEDEALCE